MEWRVIFSKGASAPERKTAVVQICDLQTILIIQLSAMKGRYDMLQVYFMGSMYLLISLFMSQDFLPRSR